MLRAWLDRLLGRSAHEWAEDRLRVLGAEVRGPLRATHLDAGAHPPRLIPYDASGARVDRALPTAEAGPGPRGRTRPTSWPARGSPCGWATAWPRR
jgi:hypothetical protein